MLTIVQRVCDVNESIVYIAQQTSGRKTHRDHIQTRHSQIIKRQRQGENILIAERKVIHHVEGILSKINNLLLIRNYGGQRQ